MPDINLIRKTYEDFFNNIFGANNVISANETYNLLLEAEDENNTTNQPNNQKLTITIKVDNQIVERRIYNIQNNEVALRNITMQINTNGIELNESIVTSIIASISSFKKLKYYNNLKSINITVNIKENTLFERTVEVVTNNNQVQTIEKDNSIDITKATDYFKLSPHGKKAVIAAPVSFAAFKLAESILPNFFGENKSVVTKLNQLGDIDNEINKGNNNNQNINNNAEINAQKKENAEMQENNKEQENQEDIKRKQEAINAMHRMQGILHDKNYPANLMFTIGAVLSAPVNLQFRALNIFKSFSKNSNNQLNEEFAIDGIDIEKIKTEVDFDPTFLEKHTELTYVSFSIVINMIFLIITKLLGGSIMFPIVISLIIYSLILLFNHMSPITFAKLIVYTYTHLPTALHVIFGGHLFFAAFFTLTTALRIYSLYKMYKNKSYTPVAVPETASEYARISSK